MKGKKGRMEYAVEIFGKCDNRFIAQVDVFGTYEAEIRRREK